MDKTIESNIILNGDAITELKKLPSESINCVMTSPPYWALRDYGTEAIIWDSKDNCEHDFEIKERQLHSGTTNVETSIHSAIHNENLKVDWKTKDGFCSKCGAWKGSLGLEPTFNLYIKHLCDIFDEVKRVLRKDGTCWVNLGDTYYSISGGKFQNDNMASADRNIQSGISKANSLKGGKELEQKNLTLIPFRFAIEMQNRGWILRNVIIWHKNNCMPSSVKDRFTIDFEYLFFFVKSKKYFFETQYEPIKTETINRNKYGWNGDKKVGAYSCKRDAGSFASKMPPIGGKKHLENGNPTYSGNTPEWNELGRNKRAVWNINTKPFREAHFATYPEELCYTPIKAGCSIGGIVLDPFFGAGTTGLVALKQNKNFIGIELNSEYVKIAEKRLKPFLEQNKLSQDFGASPNLLKREGSLK